MKVDDDSANASDCICPDCPTYNACMGEADELLFCARDKTACAATAQSCVCPDCPVWRAYELTSTYFCLTGAAS